ncbi:MAG TPA: hypothetical protein VEA44_01640 [Caulobacter sp.]|nr:hypothetical protein [Caulobacter sp.]
MTMSRRAALGGLGAAGLALAAAPAFAQEVVGPGWAGVILTLAGETAGITALDPLGPAARAGLRPGDLITGWSGGGLAGLPAALAGPPGERFELSIRRGEASRTVRLVLEERDSARP